MVRPRVLLADDHPGVVKALGRVLAIDCDLVGTVSDGGLVATTAATLQPVVALVDLHLPNASGLDACQQIARMNLRASVIIISGTFDDAIRDEALAAGATAFLHKFAAQDAYLAAIRSAWARIES